MQDNWDLDLEKNKNKQNLNWTRIGAGSLLRSFRQKPPDLQPESGTFVTVWKKISDILFLKLPTEGQHSGRYAPVAALRPTYAAAPPCDS